MDTLSDADYATAVRARMSLDARDGFDFLTIRLSVGPVRLWSGGLMTAADGHEYGRAIHPLDARLRSDEGAEGTLWDFIQDNDADNYIIAEACAWLSENGAIPGESFECSDGTTFHVI